MRYLIGCTIGYLGEQPSLIRRRSRYTRTRLGLLSLKKKVVPMAFMTMMASLWDLKSGLQIMTQGDRYIQHFNEEAVGGRWAMVLRKNRVSLNVL